MICIPHVLKIHVALCDVCIFLQDALDFNPMALVFVCVCVCVLIHNTNLVQSLA